MSFWGIHAMVNAGKCVSHRIRCPKNIAAFSNDLVKRIDMKAYGPPQIQHFGEGNKAGFTLVQLIETSNITAHFVEETDDIYLDVFSCKKFDVKEVEKCVNEYFQPTFLFTTTMGRQAPNR